MNREYTKPFGLNAPIKKNLTPCVPDAMDLLDKSQKAERQIIASLYKLNGAKTDMDKLQVCCNFMTRTGQRMNSPINTSVCWAGCGNDALTVAEQQVAMTMLRLLP